MNREELQGGLAAADEVLAENTKQVSAIVRQLAFAGLAFVWLLVAGVGQPKTYDLSGWAALSLIALSLAVAFDAGQYVATSASWLKVRRALEDEVANLPLSPDHASQLAKAELNRAANRWSWWLFFAKVPAAALGWIFAGLAVASAAGKS